MNRLEVFVLVASTAYLAYCAIEWTREMREHARNTERARERCRVEELDDCHRA